MDNVKTIRPNSGVPLDVVKWLNEVCGDLTEIYIVVSLKGGAGQTLLRGSTLIRGLPEGLSWASFLFSMAAQRELGYEVAHKPDPPKAPV